MRRATSLVQPGRLRRAGEAAQHRGHGDRIEAARADGNSVRCGHAGQYIEPMLPPSSACRAPARAVRRLPRLGPARACVDAASARFAPPRPRCRAARSRCRRGRRCAAPVCATRRRSSARSPRSTTASALGSPDRELQVPRRARPRRRSSSAASSPSAAPPQPAAPGCCPCRSAKRVCASAATTRPGNWRAGSRRRCGARRRRPAAARCATRRHQIALPLRRRVGERARRVRRRAAPARRSRGPRRSRSSTT